MDWEYSLERVTEPLLNKGNGLGKASWDEALEFIAGKLSDIKSKYGAKSLAVHVGNPFLGTENKMATTATPPVALGKRKASMT